MFKLDTDAKSHVKFEKNNDLEAEDRQIDEDLDEIVELMDDDSQESIEYQIEQIINMSKEQKHLQYAK